jgi:hypothetical protein
VIRGGGAAWTCTGAAWADRRGGRAAAEGRRVLITSPLTTRTDFGSKNRSLPEHVLAFVVGLPDKASTLWDLQRRKRGFRNAGRAASGARRNQPAPATGRNGDWGTVAGRGHKFSGEKARGSFRKNASAQLALFTVRREYVFPARTSSHQSPQPIDRPSNN